MCLHPSQPVLEASDLACGYRGAVVISEVNISLTTGKALILLGPNGAGKSTIIKTLIGALPAVHGQVTLGRKPIEKWDSRELAQTLAYVPQQETAYYPFSVRECVLMGRLPYAQGMFESQDDFEAAERAMAMARCLDLADRPVTEISGGEQQRVLFARALAQDPKLLVLDEPASHLDISHAYELLETLHELTASGVTIIAAVHDLNWAARFESECLLIGQGKVLASGRTCNVLQSPQLSECYGREIKAIVMEGGPLVLVPR